MRKLNCWEFNKCGRQAEGENEGGMGYCPASGEIRLDGIHDGVAAGRACWVVSGTYSKNGATCTIVHDVKDCKQCEFYKTVQTEEGAGFLSVEDLHEVLGD